MYNEKQERKYVLDLFMKGTEKIKDKRIAIYGLGVNTFYILEHYVDRRIVALMDANKQGDIVRGLKVLSVEEASKQVDVIVIVARASVIPIIYERIKELEEEGILIVNIFGDKVSNKSELEDISGKEYWSKNIDGLKEEISKHDIITFDVFDTLLMRRIMRPADLFEVIQKKVRQHYDINFVEIRAKAAQIATERYGIATFEEIYAEFEKISELSGDDLLKVKEIEFQTDYDFIIKRAAVVEAFQYALKLKKRVFLISDMYYTTKEMEILLKKEGIEGYENLLVSSELRCAKWPEGDLFQHLLEQYKLLPEKILHIGDNPTGDIEMARQKHIHAYHIWSAYEMLVQSSGSSILSEAVTAEDYVVVGILLARFFNSPFALAEKKGMIQMESFENIGYWGYGCLMSGFIIWLLKLSKQHKWDKVLFLARDGYPIEKIYQMFCRQYGEEHYPNGQYVLASRRALAVASITEDNFDFHVKRVIKDVMGTGYQTLKQRFGIIPDENDDRCNSLFELSELHQYIYSYKEKILLNAKKEREEYIKYLESAKISCDNRIAIFDTQTLGTAAYFFKELSGADVSLVCYILENAVDYSLYDKEHSYAYIGTDTKGMPKYYFTRSITFNECVFTSNQGMLNYFENGQPRFEKKEKNQENFKDIELVQEGVARFAKEYLSLVNYPIKEQEVSAKLGDILLGVMCSEKCIIDDGLRSSFGIKDYYGGNFDVKFEIGNTV